MAWEYTPPMDFLVFFEPLSQVTYLYTFSNVEVLSKIPGECLK